MVLFTLAVFTEFFLICALFKNLNQKACVYEMGLGVGSHNCKVKLPLTFVVREETLWGQLTLLSGKRSMLQLVLALNSLFT